jgi:hypothetical protein
MTGNGVPDTEAEFTLRYMMLIHHDDVALAKAAPPLWGDYATGKVNWKMAPRGPFASAHSRPHGRR